MTIILSLPSECFVVGVAGYGATGQIIPYETFNSIDFFTVSIPNTAAIIPDRRGKARQTGMTNKEILQIALAQQAEDMNCRPEDFQKKDNVVVLSKANDRARKYLDLPFFCNLVSYGSNVVASTDERIADFVKTYLEREQAANGTFYESFLTPRLHLLTEEFARFGMLVSFMAEYFLPDIRELCALPCPYDVRILTPQEFASFYSEKWSNALCEKRKPLDVLAAAAYDGNTLVGLAGCSADCDSMWQIGVDVLPAYRRQGIASALTSRLALEILDRGKVPFYCAAWSNIRSVRNALRSGFRPAWVECTAIPREKAEEYMK